MQRLNLWKRERKEAERGVALLGPTQNQTCDESQRIMEEVKYIFQNIT